MTHPIRKAKIHTFERKDREDGGANWIAKFFPYSTYPTFFQGVDEKSAVEKAEKFQADAIEKHEAACINRQKAREKAKAKRNAKALESD